MQESIAASLRSGESGDSGDSQFTIRYWWSPVEESVDKKASPAA